MTWETMHFPQKASASGQPTVEGHYTFPVAFQIHLERSSLIGYPVSSTLNMCTYRQHVVDSVGCTHTDEKGGHDFEWEWGFMRIVEQGRGV